LRDGFSAEQLMSEAMRHVSLVIVIVDDDDDNNDSEGLIDKQQVVASSPVVFGDLTVVKVVVKLSTFFLYKARTKRGRNNFTFGS